MFICHVAADELGAIFLFIVNKQSCSPPFVSRDRETLKSHNPSALNLPNGEEGEEEKKRKHPPTHSGFVSEPFVMHR